MRVHRYIICLIKMQERILSEGKKSVKKSLSSYPRNNVICSKCKLLVK